MKKYNFYLAGPFFNDEQLTVQKEIEKVMDKYNKTYFSPRLDTHLPENPTKKEMLEVFNMDLEGLNNCDFVLANISHRDTGTSLEIGYALAKNIPIVLFRHPILNDTPHVNLMIALACGGKVIQSKADLETFVNKGIILDDDFKFTID